MSTYMTHLQIGDRRIGPGYPTYVIAEAGINHNGDPGIASRLIQVAADGGADAVKFQKRTLSELYPEQALVDPSQEEKEVGFVLPYLEKAELSDEVMADLAEQCASVGVEFMCTPWDISSVEFLETLDVRAYKVGSPDLTNFPLLERLCDTDKPLIVSTGMSRHSEIAATVELLKSRDAQFALLHCQSTYPAPFKDINLRYMQTLREFGVPIGYSGHERGIATSTVASALGACIIERHITLDRTMAGPDHAASLEPHGFRKMVRDIRLVEEAQGSNQRSLSRGELLNRLALGKSLVAAGPIEAGETVTPEMVKVMGPGNGVSPQRIDELVGRVMDRDIAKDEQFRESDMTDEKLEELAATFPLPWGPVVRYRDVEVMARFDPDFFEFHLTDADLDTDVPELDGYSQQIVVHAPEYYHGKLLDLASEDREHAEWSADVVRSAMEAARAISGRFANAAGPVRIVVHPGGMSFEPAPEIHDELVMNLCDALPPLLQEPGVEVMIENMPPYPWYFGGQWYHNAFLSSDDMIEVAERTGARIVFDVSHAALACIVTGEDLVAYARTIAPYVGHVHIADASGTDGEGLQIDQGDIDWSRIMPVLREWQTTFVPEIWLGHRNEGEGFAVALKRLSEHL